MGSVCMHRYYHCLHQHQRDGRTLHHFVRSVIVRRKQQLDLIEEYKNGILIQALEMARELNHGGRMDIRRFVLAFALIVLSSQPNLNHFFSVH
jgi:hypothetical protein